MKPFGYYDRVVNVMEEFFKFTILLRGRTDYLACRRSKWNQYVMKEVTKQETKV